MVIKSQQLTICRFESSGEECLLGNKKANRWDWLH